MLAGIRERTYANYYDSVPFIGGEPYSLTQSVRLFGSANIGYLPRTNLQIPNQFPTDQTFLIMHPYIRTNIQRLPFNEGTVQALQDAIADNRVDDMFRTMLTNYELARSPVVKAFEEWAHHATAIIVVGDRPAFPGMCVWDLLGHSVLGPRSQVPVGEAAAFEEDVVAAEDAIEAVAPSGNAPPVNVVPGDVFPAGGLIGWTRALARPIMIPVRQNFHVNIESFDGTLEPLQAALRAAPPILPRPTIWFHFEGLVSRDIQ